MKCKAARGQDGFTIIESIVAGAVMIILCVGVLSVFEAVIKLNRINGVRLQAHSILQKEVEYYRALKFVPVNPDPALNGTVEVRTRTGVVSQDGSQFDIYVTIDNDPLDNQDDVDVGNEADCRFKEIRIRAVSLDTQNAGILSNIGTDVSFQRVRLVN